MKLYILFLAVFVVLLTSCAEEQSSIPTESSLTLKQTERAAEIKEDSSIIQVPYSEEKDEGRYAITADDLFDYGNSPVYDITGAEKAFSYIMERKGLIDKDYTYTCSKREETTMSDYYIFQEYYKGIEVYGGQFIMQADKDDGQIITLNGSHINIPENTVLQPHLTEEEAKDLLVKHINIKDSKQYSPDDGFDLSCSGIFLFSKSQQDIRVAYEFNKTDNSSGFTLNSYILDANDGSVLAESNSIMYANEAEK